MHCKFKLISVSALVSLDLIQSLLGPFRSQFGSKWRYQRAFQPTLRFVLALRGISVLEIRLQCILALIFKLALKIVLHFIHPKTNLLNFFVNDVKLSYVSLTFVHQDRFFCACSMFLRLAVVIVLPKNMVLFLNFVRWAVRRVAGLLQLSCKVYTVFLLVRY